MEEQVRQIDIEALSAWLDGELTAEQGREIEDRVQSSPALARALAELRALDKALGAYTVPAPADGLAGRVVASVRRSQRRSGIYRIVRWAAPAAAAAAILLATALWWIDRPGPGPDTPIAARTETEETAIENFDFFQDYYVVLHLETLEEIEKLETFETFEEGPLGG